MPINITNSVGYGKAGPNDPTTGSVYQDQWARLVPNAGGREYGVIGSGSWQASIGAADREVVLTPGSGFGHGILDTTAAEARIVLPASASGSRWHLISAHRDWQNRRSSFDTIAGVAGATSPAIPVRANAPGTVDDQPLWLARVDAGQSQVRQLIDLRVWGGDGGSFARDPLVLQYLSRVGTVVQIGKDIWSRTLDSIGNPTWSRTPAGGTPVGTVAGWISATIPKGWMLCGGQLLSKADYADLFALIGGTYGSTDTQFRLPDLAGRVPVGASEGDGDFNLGRSGGAKTHRLSEAEMPQHNHDEPGSATLRFAADQRGNGDWQGGGNRLQGGATIFRGGNQPHNNLQPYLALNFIIRVS